MSTKNKSIEKFPNSKGNVPNIRFSEFSEEWEVKRLGDICEIGKEKSDKNYNDNRLCIELEHIEQKLGILNGYTFLRYQKSVKNSFEKEDILFGKLRPYLRKYWFATFNGVCSSEIWVLKAKSIIPKYLYFFVQTDKFIQVCNLTNGTKMPRADKELVFNYPFYFTKAKQEQIKITNFLTKLDERISTQRELTEDLKSLIKGYQQKLFSQEIRFKDDSGKEFPKWEEKKLEKIAKIVMGQSPDSKYYNENGIGLPLIQGNADCNNRKTTPRIFTTQKTKECFIGDIIMTVRAPVGYISKSLHNACIGRGVCSMKAKEIKNFLYYGLIHNENNWVKYSQGSTFTAVSSKDVGNFKLPVPCKQEQTKIANFLSALDNKLKIEEDLLKEYENQKKYFLQNMFV